MSGAKFIGRVDLKDLSSWSASSLRSTRLRFLDEFPLVPLGDLLYQAKDIVEIVDSELYRRLTVRTGRNGVVLRDYEIGLNIATKRQYRVRSGQFIFSKIDARNGAFGVIPDELNGAIVTNDFPVFDVNSNRLDPFYLFLLTTTDQFVEFVQGFSSGTTNRQRIDIAFFLRQKIPLPDLHIQQDIVEGYLSKQNQARILDEAIDTNANNFRSNFTDLLALRTSIAQQVSRNIRLLDFSTLDRWDGRTKELLESKFQIELLGNYVTSIATGTTPPTQNSIYFDGDVNFFTPADLGKEMYLTRASRKISEVAIEDRKARVFLRGTVMFVGIGFSIGKVGLVANDYASCNQQITGFTVDCRYLLPEFVYIYFDLFKEVTTSQRTQSTLPIVNQEKIRSIPIPIPPLDVQQGIVDELLIVRRDIAELRLRSEELRRGADFNFENRIFAQ